MRNHFSNGRQILVIIPVLLLLVSCKHETPKSQVITIAEQRGFHYGMVKCGISLNFKVEDEKIVNGVGRIDKQKKVTLVWEPISDTDFTKRIIGDKEFGNDWASAFGSDFSRGYILGWTKAHSSPEDISAYGFSHGWLVADSGGRDKSISQLEREILLEFSWFFFEKRMARLNFQTQRNTFNVNYVKGYHQGYLERINMKEPVGPESLKSELSDRQK
jgi:hypothetical protein